MEGVICVNEEQIGGNGDEMLILSHVRFRERWRLGDMFTAGKLHEDGTNLLYVRRHQCTLVLP